MATGTSSSYPPPPPYYRLYKDYLDEPTSAPTPPPPIQGGAFPLFGATYTTDVVLPSLEDQGVRQLYPKDPNIVSINTCLVGHRLKLTEESVKHAITKLTQGMSEQKKSLFSASTEDEKTKIKMDQQRTSRRLLMCNNITKMVQPLHVKAPTFIGDSKVRLSWQEPIKQAPASTGEKRNFAPVNGSNSNSQMNKKARGGAPPQNQLVNRALEGIHWGGRNSGGRGRGRGRGWGGQGRGRGGYR